ncbi:DUF4365 domain-containing protein, partial [bacterium]|nr:DUF4365 domain-containing protein [bacterium]
MPTTREIDRMAQNIFNDSLPPGWLIRKQDPDIHVDYFVEIAEKSKPSGVIFGVQLKGTNSPRYSKSLIKISIKTKHLSYYLDKVKQPIFLIVVDIKKRQGFWFFVQEWAKEQLKERNWREQKKIDIKIPLRSCLSDVEYLRAEIARAEIFMCDLWPSSIPAAIQHEKESLEGLDRRVQVDISYQGGRTRYSLQARKPFDFDIQFRGSPHVKDKFADLFNRGKPAIFDTDEIIEVRGSPLLKSIFERSEKGKLFIEPERKIQTVLLLSTVDVAEQEKIVLYGVEGMMCAGKKEARFRGDLKETPLKVEFSFPLPLSLGSNALTVNFNFESSGWQDMPVLRLPHFDKLKAFFTSIQEGCLLRIVCEIKGNHIFTATSQTDIDRRFMELTIRHLQLLDKVRLIAKEANINPIYPKGGLISKDEIETILLLHQLIRSGQYRQSGNGVNFRGKLLPNDNFLKMFEEPTAKDFSGPLVVEPKDQKFKLFGEEFEFCFLRYTLTNPILLTNLSDITRENEQTYKGGVEVEWSGGTESELIISKV